MTDVQTGQPEEEPDYTEMAVWRPLPALPRRQPDETALVFVERLMELLPPQPDDVIDLIASQLLAATNMQDQNAIWESVSSKDAAGKRFTFYSAHLQASDQPNHWCPWYVVAKVLDHESGERTVLTTGAVNIVTQLVKAQVLGQLPWEAEVVAPKRPTKRGYLPLHLRWIAKVVEPE